LERQTWAGVFKKRKNILGVIDFRYNDTLCGCRLRWREATLIENAEGDRPPHRLIVAYAEDGEVLVGGHSASVSGNKPNKHCVCFSV